MSHPCHRCGHVIEDGKPFCSECGAAQIRVVTPEAGAEPLLAADRTVLANHTDSVPVFSAASPLAARRALSGEFKPCTLAAAVGLVLTFLGVNPFVASLGAGSLAVAFFRRGAAEFNFRPASGARLGALSGMLFFAMSAIFEALAVTLLHKGAELRGQMLEKVQLVAERYPASQVQPFLDFVKTPEGFAFMMAGSVVFGLIAFIVLGGAGGAIAASIMKRRSRP